MGILKTLKNWLFPMNIVSALLNLVGEINKARIDIRENSQLIRLSNDKLDKLIDLLGEPEFPPDPPSGVIKFRLLGESEMGLQFEIFDIPTTDTAGSPDIVGGVLSTKVGDAEAFDIEVAKDQVVVNDPRFVGADNAAVHSEFRFKDDQGNLSVNASVIDFILSDTIPPGDPAQISARVTGEVPDPV